MPNGQNEMRFFKRLAGRRGEKVEIILGWKSRAGIKNDGEKDSFHNAFTDKKKELNL